MPGDMTTVAIVQWDGAKLLFDQDAGVLGQHPAKGDVRKVLGALHSAARAARPSQAGTEAGIDDVFPVDLTAGGLLRWSSEHRGLTPDPQAHFERLVALAGLHGSNRTARRVGRPQVDKQLRALGKRLAQAHPERVRVAPEISTRYRCVPALSWHNGRWNHAIAWSFDVAERAETEHRLKLLIGTLETGVPKDDAAVVAYAPPAQPDVADFVTRELEFVSAMGRHRRSLALDRDGMALDVSPLERLIAREVGS